jgi:hypothetical protein
MNQSEAAFPLPTYIGLLFSCKGAGPRLPAGDPRSLRAVRAVTLACSTSRCTSYQRQCTSEIRRRDCPCRPSQPPTNEPGVVHGREHFPTKPPPDLVPDVLSAPGTAHQHSTTNLGLAARCHHWPLCHLLCWSAGAMVRPIACISEIPCVLVTAQWLLVLGLIPAGLNLGLRFLVMMGICDFESWRRARHIFCMKHTLLHLLNFHGAYP